MDSNLLRITVHIDPRIRAVARMNEDTMLFRLCVDIVVHQQLGWFDRCNHLVEVYIQDATDWTTSGWRLSVKITVVSGAVIW